MSVSVRVCLPALLNSCNEERSVFNRGGQFNLYPVKFLPRETSLLLLFNWGMSMTACQVEFTTVTAKRIQQRRSAFHWGLNFNINLFMTFFTFCQTNSFTHSTGLSVHLCGCVLIMIWRGRAPCSASAIRCDVF